MRAKLTITTNWILKSLRECPVPRTVHETVAAVGALAHFICLEYQEFSRQ